VGELEVTCATLVGNNCTDKNLFVNKFEFTPEGWKDLLRNCAVSCNLCDSGASQRHLEDDLSFDPCVCMPTWSWPMSKVEPTCVNIHGCPASACDNDPIGPWCEVVNRGCATAEGDGSWAYCYPGATMVPTEFYDIRYPLCPFFDFDTWTKSPPEFLLFMSLFHTLDTFSYTLLLSKDMGDGTSQGSCVDNEDFVDPQGYRCSGNKDVNCLAEDMFTRLGYSRDDWQDIVQNCPASCQLCPGGMSMNGISTVFTFSQYLP
jgi:hypothetical protein